MDMEDYIEILNNGDSSEVESVKADLNGDFFPLLKILDNNGLLHELQITAPEFEIWGGDYVIYVMKNNKELFDKFVNETFWDVEILNGKYYLKVSDIYDLSALFCGSGRNNIQQYVKKVLEGEYNIYDNYDIDPEIDDIMALIENLSPKNLEYLKKVFIHHLKDVDLYPVTFVLQHISDQQPSDKPIEINDENIDLIFEDRETLEYILENYLDSTVYSGLMDLYRQSSETNLIDQFYENIMLELSGFFDMNSRIFRDKNELYPIYNLEHYIKKYIEKYIEYNYYELNYYLEILNQVEECLNPASPDYIDFRDMMKIANDYLTSTVD